MAFIRWREGFSVGVPELDEQHKRLVEMLNRLYESMKAEEGARVSEEIVAELRQYAAEHFEREEAYMESINYPELAYHREVHRALSSKVDELTEKVHAGQADLTQMCAFLRRWLKEHIMKMDSRYAPRS